MSLTLAKLEMLVRRAYRDLGYQTITFRDGSIGVLKCPAKTINLMNHFSELIARELPSDCATCGGTRRLSASSDPDENATVPCSECSEEREGED
jgi:hypothetical protein